jgi:hypothetical protein
VHTHFSSLGVPIEMVCTQWFLCLFVNVLPAATVLRLWDVMLWEGPQARGQGAQSIAPLTCRAPSTQLHT